MVFHAFFTLVSVFWFFLTFAVTLSHVEPLGTLKRGPKVANLRAAGSYGAATIMVLFTRIVPRFGTGRPVRAVLIRIELLCCMIL